MTTPDSHQRARISACNVIWNEEATLDRFIESTKPFIDEWVFIHDGPCTDRSLEILEGYKQRGLNIHYEIGPRIGCPDPHRVTAYKRATEDWIYMCDPDQYPNEALTRDLRTLVDQNEFDQYEVLRTYFDGQHHSNIGEYTYFLNRRSTMWFIGAPHNWVHTRGATKRLPDQYMMYHEHIQKGSRTIRGQFKAKYSRWARTHAEYLARDFDESFAFQATPADWNTPKRLRIVAHPLLWAVFYLFYNFFYNLTIRRRYRQGVDGLKTCVGLALYSFLTYSNVWKVQREQRHQPTTRST